MRATALRASGAVMVAAEAAAIALLIRAPAEGQAASAVAGALLLHGLAAAAGAWMLAHWHPDTFGGSRLRVAAAAAVGLVLPVVGPMGLGLLVRSIRRRPADPGESRFASTSFPGLPAHPSGLGAASSGAGAIAAKLRFSTNPDDRVQAVLATGRIDGPAAVALLREALRDPHEDARLLAHALLQEREQQAESAIQHLKRQIDHAPAEQRPTLHLALAQGFWELCYQGLAAGDLETFALEQARAHLEEAGQTPQLASDTAERHLLRGRILLRLGDASGALTSFEDSQQSGMPASVIDSYLSEAAFARRA